MKCEFTISAACLFSIASASAADPELSAPTLGGAFFPVSAMWEELAKSLDAKIKPPPTSRGVVILYALKDGPLDKAGLGSLDVITHVEGKPVEDPASLLKLVPTLTVGRPVRIGTYDARRGRSGIAWDRKTVTCTPLTKGATATAVMRVTEDDVLGVTTFKHIDDPKTPGDTAVLVWYVKREGVFSEPLVRFQLRQSNYFGIQSLVVRAGERLFKIDVPGLAKSEIGSAVWEWHDVTLQRDLQRHSRVTTRSRCGSSVVSFRLITKLTPPNAFAFRQPY